MSLPRIAALVTSHLVAESTLSPTHSRGRRLDDRLGLREDVGRGALRVCNQLLSDAAARIRKRNDIKAGDIHAVRVSIKKVRALLRLIRPLIAKAAFRRENGRLRSAARHLSGIRDRTVGLKTLSTLEAEQTTGKRRRHCRRVANCYRQGTKRAKHDERKQLRWVEGELDSCRRRLAHVHVSPDPTLAVENGLRNTYHQCRRRMAKAFATGKDKDFHKWRIRLKALYYQVQFLTPLWPAFLKRLASELGVVQTLMGKDHDLADLRLRLEDNPREFGGKSAVNCLGKILRKRSSKFRRLCKPTAKAALGEKSRCFALKVLKHQRLYHNASQSRTRLIP